MERKDFLKIIGSFCVLADAGLIAGSLSSCSHLSIFKTDINENKIAIPLSLFARKDLQIVRPNQFDYDIALRKEKNGMFTALLLRCTHTDNQLGLTGNGFICNLHGSRFNIEGLVTKGPAEHSLKKYHTEIVSDNIIIILS